MCTLSKAGHEEVSAVAESKRRVGAWRAVAAWRQAGTREGCRLCRACVGSRWRLPRLEYGRRWLPPNACALLTLSGPRVPAPCSYERTLGLSWSRSNHSLTHTLPLFHPPSIFFLLSVRCLYNSFTRLSYRLNKGTSPHSSSYCLRSVGYAAPPPAVGHISFPLVPLPFEPVSIRHLRSRVRSSAYGVLAGRTCHDSDFSTTPGPPRHNHHSLAARHVQVSGVASPEPTLTGPQISTRTRKDYDYAAT